MEKSTFNWITFWLFSNMFHWFVRIIYRRKCYDFMNKRKWQIYICVNKRKPQFPTEFIEKRNINPLFLAKAILFVCNSELKIWFQFDFRFYKRNWQTSSSLSCKNSPNHIFSYTFDFYHFNSELHIF